MTEDLKGTARHLGTPRTDGAERPQRVAIVKKRRTDCGGLQGGV